MAQVAYPRIAARLGEARQGQARPGEGANGTWWRIRELRRGRAGRGEAWPGAAGLGTAWRGVQRTILHFKMSNAKGGQNDYEQKAV